MSAAAATLARLLAWKERKAIPIREAYGLSADPADVFAIAPIKMVSEQIVQAVAFGSVSSGPKYVLRWNPLSRESADLELLAQELDSYLSRCIASEQLPRVWLPHSSALTLIELIGHRYRNNERASATLKKLGWQCRALAEEASFAGQQVVAVAGDLLRKHVVTGQPPTKDAHLGALLAWLSPQPGKDPQEEADELALVPASGVLVREADDAIERLRKDAKKGGAFGATAKADIEDLLRIGAEREWDLLIRARDAFWGLALAHSQEIAELNKRSADRIFYQLVNERNPPRNPHSLALELDRLETATDFAENANVRGDSLIRAGARQKGRVIRAELISVRQPSRNKSPCSLSLRVAQNVIRARPGTELQAIGAKISGKIEEITEDQAGSTIITLAVSTGFRTVPTLGAILDWSDSVPKDFGFMKAKIYKEMSANRDEKVYGRGLQPRAATMPPGDLLEIAKSLRRKQL